MTGFDAQLAAVCRVHSVSLSTRNTSDFVDTGPDLINPWDGPNDIEQ